MIGATLTHPLTAGGTDLIISALTIAKSRGAANETRH
jgi:hypothetical protein